MEKREYPTYKAYFDAFVIGELELPFKKSGSDIQDFFTYFKGKANDDTDYFRLLDEAKRRKYLADKEIKK